MTRSNCLLAALLVWWRLGGRLVVVRPPSRRSWLPHVGVRVGVHVVSFDVVRRRDFVLWFRGRLRRVRA